MMVWRQHRDLDFPTDANKYPWVERDVPLMTYVFNEVCRIENYYRDVVLYFDWSVSPIKPNKRFFTHFEGFPPFMSSYSPEYDLDAFSTSLK